MAATLQRSAALEIVVSNRLVLRSATTRRQRKRQKKKTKQNSRLNKQNSNFEHASRLSHFFAAFALLRHENASFHV